MYIAYKHCIHNMSNPAYKFNSTNDQIFLENNEIKTKVNNTDVLSVGDIQTSITSPVWIYDDLNVSGSLGAITISGEDVLCTGVSSTGNISTNSAYQVNGTNVLTGTALGSGVVSSSLTSVGTLGSLTMGGTLNMNSQSITNLNNLTLTGTGDINLGLGPNVIYNYRVQLTYNPSTTSTIYTQFIGQYNVNQGVEIYLKSNGGITGSTFLRIGKGYASNLYPKVYLHISTFTGAIEPYQIYYRANSASLYELFLTGDTSILTDITITVFAKINSDGGNAIGTAATVAADTNINPCECLMLLTEDSMVTIGTTLPSEALGVSGNIEILNGGEYMIDGTSVLNSTTLGSGVVNSSLTSVGTLSSLTSSGNINTSSGVYQVGGSQVLNSTTLGSGVVNSSLTSVGTLVDLNVTGTMVSYGDIELYDTVYTSIGGVISIDTGVTSSDNKVKITSSRGGGGILFYTNSGSLTEKMRVTYMGDVGIGTSTPGYRLEVVDTAEAVFGIKNSDATSGVNTFMDVNDNVGTRMRIGYAEDNAVDTSALYSQIYVNSTGSLIYVPRSNIAAANHVFLVGNGTPTEVMRITSTGVSITGSISKTSGSFLIDHPDPQKKEKGFKLQHCFVESPTAGDNIYRFKCHATTDGETVEINLPDYYRFLNENTGVWINGIEHFGRAYGKINDKSTQLSITCEKAGWYDVLCIGTRKDPDAVKHFAKGPEFIP